MPILQKELAQARAHATNQSLQGNARLGVALHHLADVLRERQMPRPARLLAEEAVLLYERHSGLPAGERRHALTVLDSVLTDPGDAVALDAATGESRWVPPVGTVTNFRSGASNSLNDFLSPPRFWGFYDYPLVDGDNLICAPGGAGATVVALNKRTGELVCKTGVPGGEPGTHGSAVLSTAGGIRHTVVFLNSGPMGIAADDGRVLWRYERGAGRSVSCTPVIRDDLVFAPSGYGWGMALLKVELASPAYSYKLALHRLRPTLSATLSGSIHGAPAGGSSESP